jgi:catechol 2,3-dioxygenase-like lactoylglutathione lyase family enzyme
MKLDHTIIYCSDKMASAQFYAEILGLKKGGSHYSFEVLHVDDTLKLLFSNRHHISSNHYAFRTSAKEYDTVLSRLTVRSLPYGNSPTDRTNELEYRQAEEKGFYFDDPDGHILEVITEEVSR